MCEPVFSDQLQSESYTKISLHILDFTESWPIHKLPPPPQSKFFEKPNSRAHILFRCTKLRKKGASIPLISESVGTLLINMKLKFNLFIKASHYDPDPN